MEGKQKELYNEVMEVANKIFDGCYGTGDDIDEDSIGEDLAVIVIEFD